MTAQSLITGTHEKFTSMGKSNSIAVYTGSFDPVTLGHLHIIQRASKLFDRLIVGVGYNAEKKALFTPSERIELLQRVTKDFPNVEVKSFDGLAVKFVRSCSARIMVRGVRPLTDIAGEFTMMMANRQLDEDMETVFLMADEEFAHVSSSLIKQIALLSDDKMLSRFVPRPIIKALRQKLTAAATSPKLRLGEVESSP
jgi:pantetheine-phosphate adenylyltransferase